MMARRALVGLLCALLFTVLGFFVVMGFSLLIDSLGDALVGRVLRWVGGALGVLSVVEFLVLLVVVAVRLLLGDQSPTDGP